MSWPDPLGLTQPLLSYSVRLTNVLLAWARTRWAQNKPHLLFWEIGIFFLFPPLSTLAFLLQALTFNQTQIPLCLLTYQADTSCCKKLEYRNPEQIITITLPVWSLFSRLRLRVKMLTWQTTKHRDAFLSFALPLFFSFTITYLFRNVLIIKLFVLVSACQVPLRQSKHLRQFQYFTTP